MAINKAVNVHDCPWAAELRREKVPDLWMFLEREIACK